jgi:hypothetical protein
MGSVPAIRGRNLVKPFKSYWNRLAFVFVALLALAACGGDDATPTVAPTVAVAPVEAPATLAASAPVSESQPAAVEVTPSVAVEVAAPVGDGLPTLAAPSPLASPDAAIGVSDAITAATATPVCAIESNPDLVGYADMEARMGCPLGEATNDPVAINEFGTGPDYDRFMLWFGSEEQIYVLMPDKTWLAYSDTWSDDQPEIACNPDELDPATSPPLPRRGFGKLWCSVESVRLALGTIDREERLCQHAVVQRFEQGRLLACFEDATIRYFRVLDDGTWDMEMVQ